MTERGTEDQGEDRLHVVFTDAESESVYAAAAWYRGLCTSQGIEAPDDPVRCVLALAGALQHRCAFLESILLQAGIDPRDYLDAPSTMQ